MMFLVKMFVKNSDRTDDPDVRSACGRLAGFVGIFCNLVLFAGKLIIGMAANSVSITADAVNNLSDASSSIVTLLGFRLASRPADEKHPYGHARIEYFSGLIVAVLILVIGVELGKSSFGKILHPEPVEFSAALAVVLVMSIGVKLWMASFNIRLGKRIASTTLAATGADSRNDVISTAVVLLSCVVGRITGLAVDGYMGLLVALFILYSGVMIAKDTLDPLLGAAPDVTLVEKISATLKSEPAVLGIHDLMIHDYGPGRQFASVHAEMDYRQDVMEAHEILDELERRCFEENHVALTIHFDPIVTDDEAVNRMREKVRQVLGDIDTRLTFHDFRVVPGPNHTNLIFDVAVPHDMKKDLPGLKSQIDKAVQFEEAMTYHTVITFDDQAFNR